MSQIPEQEKLRRHRMVQSVVGTHAMEGIEPDEATKALFLQYECGEFTIDQFSEAMDAHAFRLAAATRPLAVVA